MNGDCLADGPEEVDFSIRSSCVNETTTQIFHGTRSYQKKFSIDVAVSASGSFGLVDFAFSGSAMYTEAKEQTINTQSVVQDEHTICNRGRIRVKTELADAMQFSVDNTFAAAVCGLPTTYNNATYMTFIKNWGTHTIFQIELGNKIIKRSKASLKELFQFAMTEAGGSISASGGYLGSSGSVSLNIESLKQSESFSSQFASSLYTFSLGGEEEPQPMGLKLEPITTMLDAKYWNLDQFITDNICPSGTTSGTIETLKTNIIQALKHYPEHLSAERSTDLPFRVPLVWPSGTYSLPQPWEGCPNNWLGGSRYHDTEDTNPANDYSSFVYLRHYGERYDSYINWYFCSKTQAASSDYAMDWPKGEYCIMKKGDCPAGFTEGSLKWDDEDTNNGNSYTGVRPDGSYGRDTIIYFCCREDGFANNYIFLPTDDDFVLIRKNNQCQRVRNMTFQTCFMRWDDEDTNNADYRRGSCPYDDGGSKDHKLHFCYYEKR